MEQITPGRRQLDELSRKLPAREIGLLTVLADHRYATSKQLARILRSAYISDRSATRQTNRGLSTLHEAGLATILPRKIGGNGAGSTLGIWAITSTGARLLRRITPAARNQRRIRDRDFLPSLTFLEHTLAVTELRTQLAITQSLTIQQIQTEPECWRTFLGPHGRPLHLKPDLAVTIANGEYTDDWFLEADRSTENPARIVAKTRLYRQYLLSGAEQNSIGVFPALLWVVPTPDRANQLRRHLRTAADLDPQHFSVTTIGNFINHIIAGPGATQIEDKGG